MKLPQALLQSLHHLPGYDEEAFVRVHDEAKPPVSVRLNNTKPPLINGEMVIGSGTNPPPSHALGPSIDLLQKIPWCATGYYLPQRPSFTFDPLFHAGCYYVQEASSMFLEEALSQLADLSQPLKVLDLCAAPGGKSTHMQSLISADSLLVSNEVIKPRSIVLTDNITRWGCSNVIVTNNDPKAFQKLPGYFDVMVADAPCSGSGLFRKDEEAIAEWSVNNVELCSQRQQRILADALPTLKEGGLLIYSTCSYSREEDEEIIDWLVKEMGMENVRLRTEGFKGIIITQSEAGAEGYRFYPDKIKGEGFFLACFRKEHSDGTAKHRPAKPETASAKEKAAMKNWLKDEAMEFIHFRNQIHGLAPHLLTQFLLVQPLLNIVYAGVAIGNVLKEKLVPHHALAQSFLLSQNVAAAELDYETAIKYLQRQELLVQAGRTGWQVVRYQHQNLGWINALKNRINNYYPKEIRILKAHNNTPFQK